jgi:sec-independent protein translocase protein TatC
MSNLPPDTYEEKERETKPFLEHLDDLRRMLVACIITLVITMSISFPLAPTFLRWLKAPLTKTVKDPDKFLLTLAVTDAFTLALQLAFWCGLILGAPLLIYYITKFVFPGLTRKERQVVRQSLGFAAFLFFGGVALAYFVALPIGTKVMYGMNAWMGTVPQWTIRSYISFATFTLLGFGLVFEFPVVLVILGRIGLISSAMLRRSRKVVVIISLVVAMIISPSPDVFSMLLMALPLYVLFEISIWLIWLGERGKHETPDAPAA